MDKVEIISGIGFCFIFVFVLLIISSLVQNNLMWLEKIMDMETLSSMFAFGIIITFGLFVVGCAAGSNIMPGMVVFIMLGMFVLSRALK